jgi:hypothetical protein
VSDLISKIRTEFERPFWRATKVSSSGAKRAMAVIEVVLDVHKPMPWFEECMAHGEDQQDDYWEAHRSVGEQGFPVCEETRQEDRCTGCTPEGADDATVMSVKFPCVTVRAIASALDVQEED